MTKTVTNFQALNNLENITEGQLKAIALLQFNGADYFLVDSGDEIKVYEGEESAAKESYEFAKMDFLTFADFLESECVEVEEIDGDEEKDGYIVLTNDEAGEKCAEYIKDSLWAFNAGFIIEHSKLPWEAKEMVESFQSDKCEGANDTIEALIDDIDEFIEDAISADGRGHFMNTYDGREEEVTVNLLPKGDIANETFYIYRIN